MATITGALTDTRHYSDMQSAYQRSLRTELSALIQAATPDGVERILDLACGEGAYSTLLAGRSGAHVIGIDVENDCLKTARERAPTAAFLRGDAMRLPVADASFDAVFCIQSLFSLPDSVQVLAECLRVATPRGTIVVLESDSMHQLVLPWPPELELAVREAQLAEWKERHPHDDTDKFYAGRFLPQLFAGLGLEASVTTHTIERSAPLDEDELAFLRLYAADLRARIWPHLGADFRSAFEQLFDEGCPHNLLVRDDLHIVHIETLAIAVKA